MRHSWVPEGPNVGRQFGPQIPDWLRQPQMPRQGPAQPMGDPGQGSPSGGLSGPAGWPGALRDDPGWMGLGWGGFSAAGQVLRGNENPWTGPGADPKWTPQAHGLNALLAADIYGMFNPNVDPLMGQIRQQAFMDNAGRQNALRLGAQVQGGGDPYLQAFAAMQGQMGGQSDLARLLGGAQLERGSQREKFFQDLLMQMLSGAYGIQTAGAGRPKEPGFDWGGFLGRVVGSAAGAAGGGGAKP